MNGILGFGSILAELELSTEEKQEYIDLMRSSSDRLVNTITNYVDIALIVSENVDLNYTDVHVIELINDLKNDYSKLCEAKNLSFELLLPENLKEFAIYTDLALLRKIMSHLLDNAIKFTKEGFISIGFSVKPSKIEFFIKDTGIGIEKEAQERIFEYFMQENVSTTRDFEGNELGLSITKGFLKILGGDIHLESIKDKGTTFFFSLPIRAGDTK
ncbi:MAG: HAMP domain-containing histidine kinase [Bacteroidetes bacterium]|nr:HAMP domain-containing histidine kinase [Bacteroidota bacterium]